MPEKEPYDIATGNIYTSLCMNHKKYSPDFFTQVEGIYRQFFFVYKDGLEVCELWTEENNDYIKRRYEELELKKKNRNADQPYTDYFISLSKIAAEKYFPLDIIKLAGQGIYPYDIIRYDYNYVILREKHELFFDDFFGLLLIVTPIMSLKKNLKHHLTRNFNNNCAEYKEYLETILVAKADLIRYYNNGVPVIVNRYIKELQTEPLQVENKMNSSLPLDYSNNEGYFFDNCIATFKSIEAGLLNKDFLDNTGIWIGKKQDLVAFIHILYTLKILKQSTKGKEQALKNEYKRFFMKRYRVDISKAFQPSQFKIKTIKAYKVNFNFIPEIDKI